MQIAQLLAVTHNISRPAPSPADHTGMALPTEALLTFAVALVVTVLLYPAFLSLLVRLRAAQRIATFGPRSHLAKQGTPTMGGLLFCAMALIAWIALDRSLVGFMAVFALGAGAALGVLDDVANIRGLGALGLLRHQKFLLQVVIGGLVGFGLYRLGLTRQLVPGFGLRDLHWALVPIAALAVVATTNAVNLTDGVDGLAGICSLAVLVALCLLGEHLGNASVAVLSAALAGALLAFLLYNWHPARVFMGDTGSLALGSVIVALAVELRILWLLPLLGIVFVVETLSVIINVTAITRFGRRVFLASPLHHHFEALGMREQPLVLMFGGVAVVAAALVTLYARVQTLG